MWNFDDVAVGDLVTVETPIGDSLTGIVAELDPSNGLARLHNGWCIHTTDRMTFHRKPEPVKEIPAGVTMIKVPDCNHDFSEGQCIYCRVHGS
jgi:hypothetical protein